MTHNIAFLNWTDLRENLPKRERNTHKNNFGHLLLIGSAPGMPGAIALAAEAAARVGTGKVTLATCSENIAIFAQNRPELLYTSIDNPLTLCPYFSDITAVVLGPGLGQSQWAKEIFQLTLNSIHVPCVLDADALNLLALSSQKLVRNSYILTPHPGEAGRLLKCDSTIIQSNRTTFAHNLAEKYQNPIVLKGANTLVAHPESSILSQCKFGNPGMSSAGMGDVLSGVLGGLLAQNLPLSIAASTGTVLHSLAADYAANQLGERGLLARDLMPYIQQLANPYQFSDRK